MTNSVLEEFHLKDDVKGGFVSTIPIPNYDNSQHYETMVFNRRKDKFVYRDTYDTEQEAREGHKRILDEAKANPRKYMSMSL